MHKGVEIYDIIYYLLISGALSLMFYSRRDGHTSLILTFVGDRYTSMILIFGGGEGRTCQFDCNKIFATDDRQRTDRKATY